VQQTPMTRVYPAPPTPDTREAENRRDHDQVLGISHEPRGSMSEQLRQPESVPAASQKLRLKMCARERRHSVWLTRTSEGYVQPTITALAPASVLQHTVEYKVTASAKGNAS
jgi:hypothetical protein